MIKKALLYAVPTLCISFQTALPFPSKFEKVTDHVYCMFSSSGSQNVGAIVTGEGVLLVDPPPEADLPAVLDALKSVTGSPVRWMVCTSYRRAVSGSLGHLHRQGAAFLSSKALDELALKAGTSGQWEISANPPAARPWFARFVRQFLPTPRFNFDRQIRLFPEGIEVQIIALQHKCHTGADIVVFVPDENVLLVGGLFLAGSFPEIDSQPGGGSAIGWIDGMKQVIQSVPLLKSAMPQPKPDPTQPPPEEKSLEELVSVISGRGSWSNLQEMKDLHDLAQGLRVAAERAIKSGWTLERFLAQPSLSQQREMDNFKPYATELYNALSNQ